MTDAALNKLAEKKVRESLAKNPKDKPRVLAALLAAVLSAQAKEGIIRTNNHQRPVALAAVETR